MIVSEKTPSPSIWIENASIQTKPCVAACFGLFCTASVATPVILHRNMEVSASVGERHKMLWRAKICPPLIYTPGLFRQFLSFLRPALSFSVKVLLVLVFFPKHVSQVTKLFTDLHLMHPNVLSSSSLISFLHYICHT